MSRIKNLSKNSNTNTNTNNKTIDKFHIMVVKNIFWGIFGLGLGIIVNDTVIYLSNKFKIKNHIIQNIMQITICAIVVALLHINYLYGWYWQHLTPELFFVSFFFGVQYKLLTNIQSTYILEDEK
jgi:hypothetical protein